MLKTIAAKLDIWLRHASLVCGVLFLLFGTNVIHFLAGLFLASLSAAAVLIHRDMPKGNPSD